MCTELPNNGVNGKKDGLRGQKTASFDAVKN